MESTNSSTSKSVPIYHKMWFWGTMIGLVFIFGGVLISFSRIIDANPSPDGSPITLNSAPVPGHPAPNFTLETLDGGTLTLSDFRGKPVLVNFWATWCGPCRAEFPDFQEASVDNADNLVIIGVNNTTTDQLSEVPKFVEEMGVTFPIVLDKTGDVAKAYQIFGLPTSVFINSEGEVVEVFTGPIDKAYIESKLSDL